VWSSLSYGSWPCEGEQPSAALHCRVARASIRGASGVLCMDGNFGGSSGRTHVRSYKAIRKSIYAFVYRIVQKSPTPAAWKVAGMRWTQAFCGVGVPVHLNSSLLLYNQAIYEFYACYRLCYVSLSRPTTLTRSWNGKGAFALVLALPCVLLTYVYARRLLLWTVRHLCP